jgi:hypothetical protein
MHQASPSNRHTVLIGQPQHMGGCTGQICHCPGVAECVRRLEVDKVRYRLERCVELKIGHHSGKRRLGIDNLPPLAGPVET